MGKHNQSLEILLKAESCLESPDHEVYHLIGELLCLNAKHSKSNILDAKEYFKRSIMCGKQIQTYKTLARIYRKEKDFLKAIELLESCLKYVLMEGRPWMSKVIALGVSLELYFTQISWKRAFRVVHEMICDPDSCGGIFPKYLCAFVFRDSEVFFKTFKSFSHEMINFGDTIS